MSDKPKDDQKKKTSVFSSRPVRYGLATAAVIITLLVISTLFILRIYFRTETECYDHLLVETEEAINGLESNLRSDRMTLRIIAGLIGNAGDMNSLEVGGYLSTYDLNSLITLIGVLLPDDECLQGNGHKASVSGELSFEYESVLGEHLSELEPGGVSSKLPVIRNYVPIRKDGFCIGMLFSQASPDNIAKAWIPDIYDKAGYCYVVNRRTGQVIINTSPDEITDIHDISFIQTDFDYSKEDTIQNILDGKKGYSIFLSDMASEQLYMCYLPFSLEDWEMVVFVPESAVFTAVAPVRSSMYRFLGVAAVTILLFAIWMILEIRRSVNEAEKKANTDVLTGLQNRNCYEAYLKKLEKSKESVTCLYLDANGLHELNNSRGHFAGDQMLRFIADCLKILFNTEHIYRIGGDEFVVFQTGKDADGIRECLKEFHESLSRNNYHAAVGISISDETIDVGDLIRRAEKSMYEDKQKYYDSIGKPMRV